MKMGATRYIATDEDKAWSSQPNMPFADYLNLLGVDGTLCQVGAPE